MTYDLAIIGSGSAAFSAAIRARDSGKSVLLIERGTTGGTCVNVGCIPSKALIAAANQHWQSANNRFPGITTSAEPVDMPALLAGVHDIVGQLRRDKYEQLADEYDIDLLRGDARFADAESLIVGSETVRAEAFLIATGARPAIAPIKGLDDAGYLTSTTLLELDELPASMVVLGGGYVGLEFAQAFSRLGSAVTVVVRSQLARHEEPPIREALGTYLREEGITILESTEVARVERDGDGRTLHLRGADGATSVLDTDVILVATGRAANTEDLGLHLAGIEVGEHGVVVVDEHLQTTNPRVWAAGDCCDVPQFVYVAAQMGATAAENSLNNAEQAIDWSALPRITFTDPALAAVGLTEAQAHEQGIDCRCHTLDVAVASRPWVNRDTRGAIRIVITRDTETVIGASILAPHAEDLILAAQFAIRHKLTLDELTSTWTPYLTLGEAFKLAAVSFNRDPSKLSCCA
jgi:mercuric reductase